MNGFFGVPQIAFDRSKSQSLRQQIHSHIAGLVRQGTLSDGARLPSSRLLAKLLNVSRNTVVDAYEMLLEDGLIKTRTGSGTEINHRGPSAIPNFSRLRTIARAAHYPVQPVQFEDPDGTKLYFNSARSSGKRTRRI
jgi:DNA-binding GntR family transcriptional regulator